MVSVLLIIAAMVLLPWLIQKTFKLESWVPLPMLQIATGILLGPSALGTHFPEVFTEIFTASVRASLDTIGVLAITIFAFVAGLELKPKEIISQEGNSIWLKALQVVLIPIILASSAFYLFFEDTHWHHPEANFWIYIWCMGVATSITALPMLVVASRNLGIYGTDIFRRLLALVTFDDLILWLTVSLTVALGHTALNALLFLGAVVLLYYLWPKLLDLLGPSSWPTMTVFLALALSAWGYWSGLHYVLGAFFAGMITPRKAAEWNKGMEEQQMYWLMPVFFIWTGLKVQWSVPFFDIILASLGMLVIAVSTKFAGVWLAYKQEGIKRVLFKTSLLQTKGLMEIFLATVLLKAQIISGNMFAVVVLMSLLSTIIAVPLAKQFMAK